MTAPDRLSEEALERLLRGTSSDDVAGSPLAHYLSELREDAAGTTPAASPALTSLFEHGPEPALVGEDAPGGILTRGILTWGILTRSRVRVGLRVLAAKFAALGLLAKTAVAGVAVTAAASSAGAAGVLPPPAQATFDDLVGRDADEAPVEDVEEQAPAADDSSDGTGGAEDVPPTETGPADAPDRDPLDGEVSEDATGDADGTPGVDGGEVAEDASEDRSDAGDDAPGRDGERPEPPTTPEPDEDDAGEDASPADDAPQEGAEERGNGQEAPTQPTDDQQATSDEQVDDDDGGQVPAEPATGARDATTDADAGLLEVAPRG